jgi:hypothetical protein
MNTAASLCITPKNGLLARSRRRLPQLAQFLAQLLALLALQGVQLLCAWSFSRICCRCSSVAPFNCSNCA